MQQQPEDGGLVHFASVPPPDYSCMTCKAASGATKNPIHGIGLEDLRQSAQSGCAECNLRHVSVLRAKPDIHPAATITITFEQSVTRITQHWASERVHGGLKVLLYTRFGQLKSSWPIVGVGREVEHRRTTYAPVVKEWLKTCRETHPDCPKDEALPLPTRVLDVGSLFSDRIHLRNVSGQVGSYLALSHCWGGKIAMQTTRKNISARQKGIPFNELPKTFQDAVTVTRDLGLRNIWIDALCIIQDDLEDWQKESGNMAAIYQNAYAVVGADMSHDSNGGFLDIENAGYYCSGVPVAVVKSEGTTIYARSYETHRNPCPLFYNGPGEPLSTRAWTLQEQFLASRMIHFAAKEIIWECKSTLSCECMELDDEFSSRNERRMFYESLASSPAAKFKTWYRVVNSIMVRKITKPEDLLPTLSGLARQFQDSGAGPYLAGLWEDDLPQGLLWFVRGKGTRATPYRAPSWSWPSVRSAEYAHLGGELESDARLGIEYTKILEARCTPNGSDPFGMVSSGYLRVSAPLIEVVCRKRVDRDLCQLVPSDGIIRSQGIHPEFDFEFNFDIEHTLYCMFVGELTVPASGHPSQGLVLRRCRDVSEATFERVGLFRLGREVGLEYVQGLKERIFTII